MAERTATTDRPELAALARRVAGHRAAELAEREARRLVRLELVTAALALCGSDPGAPVAPGPACLLVAWEPMVMSRPRRRPATSRDAAARLADLCAILSQPGLARMFDVARGPEVEAGISPVRTEAEEIGGAAVRSC